MSTENIKPKTCLLCKHVSIDFGTHGYSDATPGSPGEWRCSKGRWCFDDTYGYTKGRTVAETFEEAETCLDYIEEPKT